MKKHDLERVSLNDLWAFHEQICAVLVKKITEKDRRLQQRLDELGRSVGDRSTDLPQRRPYPKVEPKFRNPEDPSITWSGRGKHPRWVDDLLAAGRAMDDFRIKKPLSRKNDEERNAPSIRA
jgi:DNA-binding protein H-NS